MGFKSWAPSSQSGTQVSEVARLLLRSIFLLIEGREMLEEILSSPAKSAQFVKVCSRLARHYQFDGWLLNIENKVDPSLVPSLMDLIANLTAAVKEEVEDGLVLWYDSVTVQVMVVCGVK